MFQRLGDLGPSLVEQHLGVVVVGPSTGHDLGGSHHFAPLQVDGGHGHDHALLRQDHPVAQHAVADVPHRTPVDEEVPARHRPVTVQAAAVQAHGIPCLLYTS